MQRLGLTLVATIASWLAHTTALPCSPIPSIGAPTTSPRDGAQGVPRDAKVALAYPTSNLFMLQQPPTGQDFTDLVVRPRGGEPIAGTVQLLAEGSTVGLIFRPDQPLAVSTTYEVLDRVREAASLNSDTAFGELEVRLSFTTGATSLDAGASAPPGPIEVAYECCEHMCCSGTSFTLSWPDEADRFYLANRLAGPSVLVTGNSVRGVIAAGGTYGAPDLFGDGTFQVYAFNVASLGHSTPSTVFVRDPCAPPTPIPDAAPDASEPRESTSNGPGDQGCRSGSATAWTLLGLLGYLQLKRSHRAAPSRP